MLGLNFIYLLVEILREYVQRMLKVFGLEYAAWALAKITSIDLCSGVLLKETATTTIIWRNGSSTAMIQLSRILATRP